MEEYFHKQYTSKLNGVFLSYRLAMESVMKCGDVNKYKLQHIVK